MLKIASVLLLAMCLSLAAARPGYLHGHHHHFDYPHVEPLLHAHHEPLLHAHHEPLHVAKIVHVPAAVSHQSSTVIHTVPHHVIKPIVVPVLKTLVHPAPIIKAYHPAPAFHYDPFHHHHYDHHFGHPFDHHHFH